MKKKKKIIEMKKFVKKNITIIILVAFGLSVTVAAFLIKTQLVGQATGIICPVEPTSYPTDSWQRVWCKYNTKLRPATFDMKYSDGPNQPKITFNENWGAKPLINKVKKNIGFISGRNINFDQSGVYFFEVGTDNGVRVWIDGVSYLNEWHTLKKYKLYTFTAPLTAGEHKIRLDYFHRSSRARLTFDYLLTKLPMPIVNFQQTGLYTFQVGTENKAKLWIDDVLLLDEWHTVPSYTKYSFKWPLTAGEHKIKMENSPNSRILGITFDYAVDLSTPKIDLATKRKMENKKDEGKMFCGRDEVVCGAQNREGTKNQLHNIYCCKYSNFARSETTTRVINGESDGADLFCGDNEVVCGTVNDDNHGGWIDYIQCCSTSDLKVLKKLKRLVDSNEITKNGDGGNLFCDGPFEVVCGAKNNNDNRNVLDKLYCCKFTKK